MAAAGNHGDSGNPLEFPAALIGGLRGGRGIGLSVGATMPNGQAAAFSTHNRFVSLAAPGASAGDCRFGVFSTLPATTAVPWTTEDGCDATLAGIGGAHYAYGEGTSFAAPIVAGLAALAWQAKPGLASEQVGEVLTRAAAGRGWNERTGAGVADGMRAVEMARIYDVLAPRARARVHRHGNRVRVRLRRSPDRTGERRRARGPRHLRAARLSRRRQSLPRAREPQAPALHQERADPRPPRERAREHRLRRERQLRREAARPLPPPRLADRR